MGEIKQTNFRIDTSAADKFRAFCEEHGWNQAQGFDHMIQVIEMDQAKAIIPERGVEIEEFEKHVKSIMSGFLYSLELAKNTEVRVLEQFQSKLESKDKTIGDLQVQVIEKNEALEVLKGQLNDAVLLQNMAEERAQNASERMKTAEKSAKDKEALYETSQFQLKEALDKLADYPVLKASEADLRTRLVIAEQMIKDKDKEAEFALERAQKAVEQARMDTQLAADKELMAVQKEHQKELQVLRDKMDALKDKMDVLKDANSELKADNARLSAENAGLTTDNARLAAELAGLKALIESDVPDEDLHPEEE